MKKLVLLLCVFVMLTPAFAGLKVDDTKPKNFKGNHNAVIIYNYTGIDIAYVMDGAYGGGAYGIQKGRVDIYHSGIGDEYAAFEVGVCRQMDYNGGSCHQADSIQACIGGHYNADLIKSIQVNSLNSCTVTCLDGGSASCKQS